MFQLLGRCSPVDVSFGTRADLDRRTILSLANVGRGGGRVKPVGPIAAANRPPRAAKKEALSDKSAWRGQRACRLCRRCGWCLMLRRARLVGPETPASEMSAAGQSVQFAACR
jgi:hypothetical protein